MTPRQLEDRLDRYARAAGVSPVPAFYIWGEIRVREEGVTLYSDEGLEYCEGCASDLLAKALPHLPEDERNDHRISHTDLDSEDTSKTCRICGALLDYALNAHGVASELDHYIAYPPAGDLHPGDAFHIARMIEAAPEDRDVVRLAEDAVRHLPVARRH